MNLFIEEIYPILHICVRQKYQPLHSITDVTPFAAIISTKYFRIIISPVHQSGGILAHSSIKNRLNLGMLVGLLAWTARFRSFHSISIGLWSGLWLVCSETLICSCFNHSLVVQFVCLWLLSCWTDTLIFSCIICWYNSDFIAPLMITSCLGLLVTKYSCLSYKVRLWSHLSTEHFTNRLLAYPHGLEQTVDGNNGVFGE